MYDKMNKYDFKKVALYIRRSRADEEREKRTGEDTLVGQLMYMEKYLRNLGITDYDVYKEVASGASIENRKVFKGLLKLIDQGVYDAIAVKETSRITRGAYQDLADIERIFKKNRIKIIVDGDILDLNDYQAAFTYDMQLFMSRAELKQYTNRVTSAKKAFAMMGKWMPGGNAVPFGYQVDEKTRKLVPDKEKAEIIKFIYHTYVYGKDGKEFGYRAISNELFRLGIKSPRGSDRWDQSVIKNILTNPVYKGDVRYNYTEEVEKGKKRLRPEEERIYVPNAHEPIVDPEVWEKAFEKTKNPKRNMHKGNPFKEVSPLTGLIICANCEKHMFKSTQYKQKKDENGEYVKFPVVQLRCRTLGCKNNVKYEAVEEAVVGYLKHLLALDREEFAYHIQNLVRVENRLDEFHLQHKEAQLERINKEIEKWNKRLKAAKEMREDGEYTREEFLERKKEIEEEIRELRAIERQLLQAEETAAGLSAEDIDNARENIEVIYDYYLRAKSNERKNELLSAIFYEIVVKKIRSGYGTKPPELELRCKLKEVVRLKNLLQA
ncbi:recombinase family protein [Lihuaxuella thermophila]|uniref:Site-specific DNA recombinase n=1 Tax=Lihuaxuella thermophila TaxID=1173111 RepID=A0A1H8ESA1_9BACL|nr:recombinase family protein [Lihuaxuella thermophila]SEN22014.1 Site-specific DNA recombinase [Lihuaxuella thermophila]